MLALTLPHDRTETQLVRRERFFGAHEQGENREIVMAAEAVVPEEPDVMEVQSTVEIDAAPDQVWKQVISFPDLPEPDDWVFHTGVAYPVRAEITGRGPGAERRCVFSTGTFVEPIDVWDEPRRLAFAEGRPLPPRPGKTESMRMVQDAVTAGKRVHRLERRREN